MKQKIKTIFLSFSFFFVGLISYAQETNNGDLLNKNVTSLNSVQVEKFQIDNRIKVLYESVLDFPNPTMTNYLVFDDTIIFIQKWNDNSMFGEPSTLLSEHIDSSGIASLQNYFFNTYQLSLNYKDGVKGIIGLTQVFALRYGPSAIPSEAGEKYLSLRETNLSVEQKTNYLTSINITHALMGYLLLSQNETYKSPYMIAMKENKSDVINYRHSCMASKSKPLEEIITHIKEISD